MVKLIFTAFVLISLFVGQKVKAQFRDKLSLALASNSYSDSEKSDKIIKVGLPPLFLSQLMLTNTFSYDEKYFALSENKFYSLNHSLWIKYNLDSSDFMTFGQISQFSQSSKISNLKNDSYNGNTLIVYNLLKENKIESYQLGFIYLGRHSKLPVMPVVGYSYESISKIHKFRISYPQSFYIYQASENSTLLINAGMDRSVYNLENAKSEYLLAEKRFVSVALRQKINNIFTLGFKVGQVLRENNFAGTQRFSDKSTIYKGSYKFAEISISVD